MILLDTSVNRMVIMAMQDTEIYTNMARPEGVEPPTAWFVARLEQLTLFINQSLAVLAQSIPQLSYQSLTVDCAFKLAQI